MSPTRSELSRLITSKDKHGIPWWLDVRIMHIARVGVVIIITTVAMVILGDCERVPADREALTEAA